LESKQKTKKSLKFEEQSLEYKALFFLPLPKRQWPKKKRERELKLMLKPENR